LYTPDVGAPISNSLKAHRAARREFRIAGRLVSPELNRVMSPSGSVQVEPKVMGVLLCLAGRAGDVVPKEALLSEVWPGVHVSDDALVRAVGEVRRLFEDGATPVIETIRTRGYRLVAPVVYDPADEERPHAPPQSGRSRRALPYVLVALLGALCASLLLLLRREAEGRPLFSPLTSLPGNEYDPALAPDGTRVAFAWDGGSDGPTDLYLKVVGEESMLRLTHDTSVPRASDRAPVWSPDGRRIAFVRECRESCTIATVSSLGGVVDRVAPCASREYPRFSWSPDGRVFAVTRRIRPDAPFSAIHLLSVDGHELSPLATTPAGDFIDTSPAFSPDGTEIAFVRGFSDSVGDLYRVRREGGPATRLTFDNADVLGFSWFGGGSKLAFSSNRAGMFSLWSVGAKGGEPTLLAGGGRKLKHPSAARDSSLAYEAWNYDMNLFVERVGGSPGRALAPASDEWTFEPRWSPDGSRVAFVSTRSGSYEVWSTDAEGREPRRLTAFGGPYVGTPRFSPDGRRIVFVARPHGRAQVFMSEADGRAPVPLTEGPGDAAAPSFAADGRSVLYGSRQEGDWQIYRFELKSGRQTRVTEHGGFAALESPDGEWMYFTRLDRNGLFRTPKGGGAEALVSARILPEDWAAWGVGRAGVFWLEPASDGGDPRAVLLEPGASEPRPLGLVHDLAWPGIDLSPDGTTLLYSRLGHRDSNLVLLSFRR
jgi:Tol biopolymer transport system component/DNA-binding winged helix-turn-helix (wHTH) protein